MNAATATALLFGLADGDRQLAADLASLGPVEDTVRRLMELRERTGRVDLRAFVQAARSG